MKTRTKDSLAILLYFAGALASFNVLNTLPFHILGVALIIAASYGFVCAGKKKKFLF